MRLFKLRWKRINNRYYYHLLLLSLVCILLFSSVGFGKAQQTNTTSQPTNTNQQTTTTTPPLQTRSETPTIRVTSINNISPKEFYISIPQWWLVRDDYPSNKQQPLKVVVTGENFPLQDNSLNNKIELKIGQPPKIATTSATEVTGDGKAFFAQFNNEQLKKLSRGTHPVSVEVGGNIATVDPQVSEGKLEVRVIRPVSGFTTFIVLIITTILTLIPVGLIYVLTKEAQQANLSKIPLYANRKNLNSLEWIILDRQTNTFSLARTQFVWWMIIIVFGYLFLFIGRGLIQGVWEFIPLSGFGYTFLISLGTLVTAQATSEIRGSKGSGEVYPGWSDLVVHGGVVALERVQQVVWNIIIGIAFIVILLVTYTTASSLPTIPNELLVLMGISAGGYIGGKVVRKPGPNISQVLLTSIPNNKTLIDSIIITGTHFSLGGKKSNPGKDDEDDVDTNTMIKDAGVIVQIMCLDENKQEQGKPIEIKKDDIITLKTDPSAPMEFCRRFKINLANVEDIQGLSDNNWLEKFSDCCHHGRVKITVINADGQRVVWDGSNMTPERETPVTKASSAIEPPE